MKLPKDSLRTICFPAQSACKGDGSLCWNSTSAAEAGQTVGIWLAGPLKQTRPHLQACVWNAQAASHRTNVTERLGSIVSQDPCQDRCDGKHSKVKVLSSAVICCEAEGHLPQLPYDILGLIQRVICPGRMTFQC